MKPGAPAPLPSDPEPGPRSDPVAGPGPASGRRLALLLAGVGVLVLVAARGFVTSFPTDPLGPRAFPALAAALFLVAALGVARRPGPPPIWPPRDTLRRQGLLLLALASYAALVGPLGFVPTTALVVAALGRLFGARPLAAVATGAMLAAGLWALFGLALGMPLPVGSLFVPGR